MALFKINKQINILYSKNVMASGTIVSHLEEEDSCLDSKQIRVRVSVNGKTLLLHEFKNIDLS